MRTGHRLAPASAIVRFGLHLRILAGSAAYSSRPRLRPTPNPLAHHYQKPPESYPDWQALYADPRRPFHIDLGCGKGHLVHRLAGEQPEMNFLGLELKENCVRPFEPLPNLAYFCCNVNVALLPLLHSFADGSGMSLRRVSIFYPDPWFKKRHAKRRMVTPQLAAAIHRFLDDGPHSEVYLETDFGEGFFEAKDAFLQSGFALEEDLERYPPFRFGETDFSRMISATNPNPRIFTATFRRAFSTPAPQMEKPTLQL